MRRSQLLLTSAALLALAAVVWMFWAFQQGPPAPTPPPVAKASALEPAPREPAPSDEAVEAPAPAPAPVEAPAERLHTVVGQVTSTADGNPIPGITVRVIVGGRSHKAAQTNAEGEYTLTGVPQRVEVLEFSGRGYESLTFEDPSFPRKSPRVRWDVEMAPAPGLFGRVVTRGPDGALRPVPDAWVGVRRGGSIAAAIDRVRRWRSEAATRSDWSGRFALDIDTDDNDSNLWTLEARHAQYGKVREVIEGVQEATLVLPGGGYISGRVVDSEGDPVPEFSVSTSGLVYGVGGPKAQSFEEGTGRFRLGPLAEGSHTLWAVAPGFQPGEVKGVEVKIGEETANVTITVKPSMTLTGRVTDARTGRPVEGALVRPAEWHSKDLAESVSAYSDADGRYRLPSLPGPRTSIVVQADGYREILAGGVAGKPGEQVERDFSMSPIEDDEAPGRELTGIGAVLMRSRGGILVHKLVDGGPAQEVLREGDVIVQVNDMEATRDLAKVVQAIRGEIDTDVDLWVKREGSEEPERVTLRRARVVLPNR